MEEKERCNITWIFVVVVVVVFVVNKKKALSNRITIINIPLAQTKPQYLCLVKLSKVAIMSKRPIGFVFDSYSLFSLRWPEYYNLSMWQYWLPAWAYSIYIIEKKKRYIYLYIHTCLSVKSKTFIQFQRKLFLEADFHQEKQMIKQSNARFPTGWPKC